MTSFQGLLNRLRGELEKEGVPFAVGGSFALAAQGHARATNDLDIMVLVPELTQVHRAMSGGRFTMINEVTFQDSETGLYIDLHPVVDDAQAWAFETATREPLHGSAHVRVLNPEGLVVMLLREATHGDPKSRPLRLRDIELLAGTKKLQWDTIREWAQRMGYKEAYAQVAAEGKPPL